MNLEFFCEYVNLIKLIFFSFLFSIFILFLSFYLSKKNIYLEKLLPYECGFSPFEDARKKFNINFYIVGILFIIFDLEISFLFPWIINLSYTFKYILMLIFLYILTFGFIYEWKKGALNWK